MNNMNTGEMPMTGGQIPTFNSFSDFLKSPQALALGLGLLQASGPSTTPISLGQAFGQGILNMQQVGQQGIENQYKQAMLNNSLSETELRKKEIQMKALDQQQKQKSAQLVRDALFGSKDPASTDRSYIGAQNADPSFIGPQPMNTGLSPIGGMPQPMQSMASGSGGLIDSLNPQQKQIAALMLGSDDLKGVTGMLNDNILRPNDIFSREDKLRNDYTNASKDFKTIYDAYGRIQASATNPSPAGDMAMIFSYMKLLDPGSTVREGEYATAQNAASIPETIRAKYNRIVNGESLTNNMRQDFLSRSEGLYGAQNKRQQNIEKTYRDIAKRSNVNPDNVVIDYRVSENPGVNPVMNSTTNNTQEGAAKVLRYNPKTRSLE